MLDKPLPRPCPGRLAGRVAVVTAAASGIGRASAIRLAEEGASVVAVDVDPGVAATAKGITAAGFEASSMVLDCSSRPDVERVFSEIEQRSGRVDILVNGVGRSARERLGNFATSDPEVWDMVIRLSLRSTMLCARQVVPGMLARRAGRIVNISSVAWLVPTPYFSDYAAAKAGVVGFTRVLAVEMARKQRPLVQQVAA
jgi:NAD(P)-dependent dehydrogenase (short-subunit alcohol dehydrogenase family)